MPVQRIPIPVDPYPQQLRVFNSWRAPADRAQISIRPIANGPARDDKARHSVVRQAVDFLEHASAAANVTGACLACLVCPTYDWLCHHSTHFVAAQSPPHDGLTGSAGNSSRKGIIDSEARPGECFAPEVGSSNRRHDRNTRSR